MKVFMAEVTKEYDSATPQGCTHAVSPGTLFLKVYHNSSKKKKSDLCFGMLIHFQEPFFVATDKNGLKPVVSEMEPKASRADGLACSETVLSGNMRHSSLMKNLKD